MDEYYKVEGLQIAGHDIYVKEQSSVDKVGIVLRDLMIENLKAKKGTQK